MEEYDVSRKNACNDRIFSSYIHDAEITSFTCDRKNKCLSIRAVNAFFHKDIYMEFADVKAALFVDGGYPEGCDTIHSFTLEDEPDKNPTFVRTEQAETYLYFLKQTAALNEVHILAKKLLFDESDME